MSVYCKVILHTHTHTHTHTRPLTCLDACMHAHNTHTHTHICMLVSYANLPTGLWTINLTVEVVASELYKISLTLLQALKSYLFVRFVAMLGWKFFLCVCASSEVGMFLFDSVVFCWKGFCCRPVEHQGKINKRKPTHINDTSSEWFCCRPVEYRSKLKKWYPCVYTDTSPDSVLFQSLPGRPAEAVPQQPGQWHPPLQL